MLAQPSDGGVNDGTITSTTGPATLTASDFFNLANGTIGTSVTLAGTASIQKRTNGTVYIYGTVSSSVQAAGVFDDDGNSANFHVPAYVTVINPISPVNETLLYWDPPSDLPSPPTWNTVAADDYWFNSLTHTFQAWPTTGTSNYVAVFDVDMDQSYTYYFNNNVNTVNVSATVTGTGTTATYTTPQVEAIEFDYDSHYPNAFDIEDDSSPYSFIEVPEYANLTINVAADEDATIGSAIAYSVDYPEPSDQGIIDPPVTFTALVEGGSVTKEGDGTLVLNGQQPSPGSQTFNNPNYYNDNCSTYVGGTFIDAGIVQVAGTGLGGSMFYFSPQTLRPSYILNTNVPDAADLTVDDGGELSGTGATVTSLNSSFALSTVPPSPNGEIASGLNVEVGGTPGDFAGQLDDGLTITSQNTASIGNPPEGLLMTLTGSDNGGVSSSGGLQFGDGITNESSFNGNVQFQIPAYDLVFDVAPGTEQGDINCSGGGSLVKTGPGELVLGGDNSYDGDTRIEDGTLQLAANDASAIQPSTVVVDNDATFDLDGNSFGYTFGQGYNPYPMQNLIVNDGTIESSNGTASIEVTGRIEDAGGSIANEIDLNGVATMLVPSVATTVTLSGENTITGTTIVAGGMVQEGENSTSGLSNHSPLLVEGGATINLGDNNEVQAYSVTLLDGTITNGTLGSEYFTLASGTISASLTEPSDNQAQVAVFGNGTDANTVILTSSSYCGGLTGPVTVTGGTLQVDYVLGSTASTSTVSVTGSGVLEGCGTLRGSVSIDSDGTGGTLDLDTSLGPVLRMSSLALDPGATVEENATVPAFELADVTGALSIPGTGTVNVSGVQPSYLTFQTLFEYGTLSLSGSLSGWTIIGTSNDQLIDDVVADQIDLVQASTAVLDWDGGTSGTWNSMSWEPYNGGTPEAWPGNAIAVFPSSRGSSITIQSGYAPTFAAMEFEGGTYVLSGTAGSTSSSPSVPLTQLAGNLTLEGPDYFTALTVASGMLNCDGNIISVNGPMGLASGAITDGTVRAVFHGRTRHDFRCADRWHVRHVDRGRQRSGKSSGLRVANRFAVWSARRDPGQLRDGHQTWRRAPVGIRSEYQQRSRVQRRRVGRRNAAFRRSRRCQLCVPPEHCGRDGWRNQGGAWHGRILWREHVHWRNRHLGRHAGGDARHFAAVGRAASSRRRCADLVQFGMADRRGERGATLRRLRRRQPDRHRGAVR